MDSIIRYLLKKNPSMTRDEAEQKADEIWEDYKSANKELLSKRDQEDRRAFERSIASEFNSLAAEELSEEELKDYCGDIPVEIWDVQKKKWISKQQFYSDEKETDNSSNG